MANHTPFAPSSSSSAFHFFLLAAATEAASATAAAAAAADLDGLATYNSKVHEDEGVQHCSVRMNEKNSRETDARPSSRNATSKYM
jgi:hypothetical protein